MLIWKVVFIRAVIEALLVKDKAKTPKDTSWKQRAAGGKPGKIIDFTSSMYILGFKNTELELSQYSKYSRMRK